MKTRIITFRVTEEEYLKIMEIKDKKNLNLSSLYQNYIKVLIKLHQ